MRILWHLNPADHHTFTVWLHAAIAHGRHFAEDGPFWNCRTMGNRICG